MMSSVPLRFLQQVSEWNGSFWLPEAASVTTKSVDPIFYLILIVTGIFLLAIVVLMLAFMVMFRKRSDQDRTSPIDGSHTLELFWAGISTVGLMVFFVAGAKGYMELVVAPGDAMEVRVTGQKWYWTFDYPKEGISISASLDAQKLAEEKGELNGLVVPVGKPVKLIQSSVDVLHAFYVPAFRIKKDVIPNRYTSQWFEAEYAGVFDVTCTEYCGTDHSRMTTKVIALEQAEWDAWVAKKQKESGPSDGPSIFAALGCGACHNTDATKKIGPGLGGLAGRSERLTTGESVIVDDNYLRESIVDPGAKVVDGYGPVMPSFAGRLDDAQINTLIDYLKSFK
jgi:cytochrome c oxidase subunit 2